MLPNQQNPFESDSNKDPSGKTVDQQPELANKSIAMAMPLQASVPAPIQGDGVLPHPLQRPIFDVQSTECPIMSDALNQQENLIIEEQSA